MKFDLYIRRILCVTAAVIIAVFCTATALAEDYDGDGIDDDFTRSEEYENTQSEENEIATETEYIPETEEYTEPSQEYTEPETEAAAQYTEPAEETTEYAAAVTEAAEENSDDNYYREETEVQTEQYYDESFTEAVKPTLDKTVSDKTYSTSNTAGIASWLCVIAGVIVMAIVLISTKASGKFGKNSYGGDYKGSR